jgi:uncharacterized protein (UPF0212 family)
LKINHDNFFIQIAKKYSALPYCFLVIKLFYFSKILIYGFDLFPGCLKVNENILFKMDYKVYNKDPMVLVNAMELYFKDKPPDCTLYSQDNYGVLIHKELLYQTPFMRDMVKSVSTDSKIEVICHSLSTEELEVIVDFIYNGRILCTSEIAVYRAAKNLRDLFGFPLKQYEISETKEGTGWTVKSVIFGSTGSQTTEIRKNQRKQKLDVDDFTKTTTKIETIKVKQEFVLNEENDYDLLSISEKEYKGELLDKEINHANLHPVKVKFAELGKEFNDKAIVKCFLCEKELANKYILIRHLQIVHKKMDYTECPNCKEVLKSEASKMEHVALKHPISNLNPVKVKFSKLGEESQQDRQKRLSQHVTTDNETGLEACNFCQKVYQGNNQSTRLRKLMDHIDSVHLKNKSYECQFCERKYLYKSNLCTHLRKNHGVETDKIVKCSLCEKVVKNIYSLKRHLQFVHKKSDCSECPICKEVLESQASKMEHVAVKHPEKNIQDCQYCDFKCLKATTLKNHWSQKHPEQFEPKLLLTVSNNLKSCRVCSVCKLDFQSRIRMIEHCISSHPDIKVHSCPFCDVKYLLGSNLENHISTKHPEQDSDISHTGKKGNIRTCPICKIVFKSRSLMMKHFSSVHPEEKIYSCSLCNYKFRTFTGLNIHVFNRHERKVTDKGCSFCGKEFASKVDLKNHITTEHKEKRYECSKCEASYLNKISLLKHIEQVHEGKKHQCPTCGEVFDSIYRYETHIAVKHDESRLFKCSLCKSAYAERSSLKKHIAFVHEKVSGHLCPHCGKNFQVKDILRDHILVVHEGKKYNCDLCTRTFTNKSSLRSHVSQIHEGNKPPPVKCSLCEKFFQSGMKRDIREVHEGKRPYACHLCGLAFSQNGNLKTHMKGKHKDAI